MYSPGFPGEALFTEVPILIKQSKEAELRRVLRKPVDVDLFDDSEREAAHDLAEVVFEPPDHHIIEHPLANLDARQNRCGSRISKRAETLFEWPLWGVADRNRRC